MPAVPPAQALLLAPLLILLLALTPALAPVRRAFLTPCPALTLGPDETLLAEVRPDARVLGLMALGAVAATVTLALAEQLLFGADPLLSYLPLAPFVLAALARLCQDARCRWAVTDRRVVTELGASLPLTEIGRIAVAPARLQLDGRGSQSLRLTGLADAPGAARLIRGALAAEPR